YLKYHSRETEVIMRALAKYFGEDENFWGITGLLHDLDMDETGGDIQTHGIRTIEILKEEGYDIPVMFRAIKSHVESLGVAGIMRESKLEFALSAAENITGLITAYALMRPEKMQDMKSSSLNKKFKSKAFAANVSRELINDIDKTGLDKSEFYQISIKAMQEIAHEVGF
ncbi:HD domain-containing protein, partial [Bacteroidota bacterium]